MKLIKFFLFFLFPFTTIIMPQSISESEKLLTALLEADGITNENVIQAYKANYNSILNKCKIAVKDEKDIYTAHSKLFKLLHSDYLEKYKEEAYISSLLKSKEFNCLTAVILYQLICYDINLNINLYTTQTHIYATVSRPGEKDFIIEFTDPIDGFDEQQGNSEFIKYLIDYKFITSEELKQKGEEEIYKEFRTSTRLLAADNLIAEYYSNLANYNLSKNNSLEAYRNIKKSLLIASDSARIELHNYIWSLHFNSIKINPVKASAFLLESMDTIPSSVDFKKEMITASEFIIISSLDNKNFQSADTIYNKLLSVINDETLNDNVHELYILKETSKVKSYGLRGNYEEAFLLAGRLYSTYKARENLLDLYLYAGNLYFSKTSLSGDIKKAMEIADSIILYAPDIESVKDNYVNSRIQYVMETGLYKTNPEQGRRILLNAKNKVPGNPLLKKALSYIFHELAMAEIRNRNYKKAVEILKEGLRNDPDNFELKYELKLAEELLTKR